MRLESLESPLEFPEETTVICPACGGREPGKVLRDFFLASILTWQVQTLEREALCATFPNMMHSTKRWHSWLPRLPHKQPGSTPTGMTPQIGRHSSARCASASADRWGIRLRRLDS